MKITTLIILLILTVKFSCSQSGPGGVGNAGTNVLWLRPDGITTLVDDDDIPTWVDLSGNANDVSQPEAAFTPIYKTNIKNGQPVVRFNKLNGRIRRTGFTGFPTTVITEIYVNRNNGEVNDGILSYASSSPLHNDFLLYSSNNLYVYRNSPIFNTGITLNDNAFHIVNASWRSVDGRGEVWVDGTSTFNATGGGTGTSITSGGCFAIAGEQDVVDGGYASNQAHFGDFGDVIVYNTYLNLAQQIIVSNYLSAKYDIPLTANNFYNEDNAANGNYDFEVAGIGRVNAANLHNHAKGSAIVEVLNPTNLGDDEFLMWGHNNGIQQAVEFSDVPPGVEGRFQRVWRASEVNLANAAVDVGAIDMRFDLSSFSPNTATDLRLLVDTDNDGQFMDETPIAGAVHLGADVYEFAGVTAITNGVRFTMSTISLSQTPLPVELLSFEATRIDARTVLLDWQTASEINNDFFTVERSTDIVNWEILEKVNGVGNSIMLTDYSVVDKAPHRGISYYRLKQTDFNGEFQYSPIVSVDLDQNQADVSIYPNPAETNFTISGSAEEIAQVSIYDVLGIRMNNLVERTDINDSQAVFDISQLKPGVYYIKTTNTCTQLNRK